MLFFSVTLFVFVSFPSVSPCCSVSTVADCSYRLRGEEQNINHLTCRRKPDVFPLHLSGAAVRASVKVHQVPAPPLPPSFSPPSSSHPSSPSSPLPSLLHTPFIFPLISISVCPPLHHPTTTSPPPVQLKVGLALPQSLPLLLLTTTTSSLSVRLSSNSCSSPLCFLSRCTAPPNPPTPAYNHWLCPRNLFLFFLSTSIMALDAYSSFFKMLSAEGVTPQLSAVILSARVGGLCCCVATY